MHLDYSDCPAFTAALAAKLSVDGYAVACGIDSSEKHLALASCFGRPALNADGGVLSRLTVKTQEHALPKSLSAIHGNCAFPFHTDTAFWPLPCHYLPLRAVEGDLRRTTRILAGASLLEGLNPVLVERSCWTVNTGVGAFYANLLCGSKPGLLRLDFGCMKPANSAARGLACELTTRTQQAHGIEIAWSAGMVLILNNWRMLHARSGPVEREGLRVLERIHLT